jgi:DNA-binding response OmpR family regulator
MPPHILLVDDDPAIRFALTLKLSHSGYSVGQATDGDEALQALAKQPADLVILDVGMPRMDGYTTAKAMFASPATRDVPVLFLTAQNLDVPDAVKPLVGRHGFLTKPFSPRDVVATVDRLLRGH